MIKSCRVYLYRKGYSIASRHTTLRVGKTYDIHRFTWDPTSVDWPHQEEAKGWRLISISDDSQWGTFVGHLGYRHRLRIRGGENINSPRSWYRLYTITRDKPRKKYPSEYTVLKEAPVLRYKGGTTMLRVGLKYKVYFKDGITVAPSLEYSHAKILKIVHLGLNVYGVTTDKGNFNSISFPDGVSDWERYFQKVK